MILVISPLPFEGTEDFALPSRDVFCFHSNAAMPGFGISVYLFELSVNCTSLRQSGKRTQGIGLLATCAEKGREDSLQHSLATYRRRLSRTLAAWRMTALIAATTDTMSTRITSREAITEPKNRAASTSPITDAINSAASPALRPPKPTQWRRQDFVSVGSSTTSPSLSVTTWMWFCTM